VDLSRVLWIGGPDDGPRSAVAAGVAARLGLALHPAGGGFRALLAELRVLDADALVVEGDFEPKDVAAVLHRADQAVFVGDSGRDVQVLRLASLPASLDVDDLVEEAAQRLSR
jgi:hypothetical protein